MFTEAMKIFMPEIKNIEHKTNNTIKKHTSFILYSKQILQKRESHLWLPLQCLLAAKISGGLNKNVVNMAKVLQLLDNALHTHWQIADSIDNANMKQEIQYPVLFGDYLYSQMYMDICQNGLGQYIKDISTLLATIHEEKLMMKNENRYDEELVNIYGLLGSTAFYLGAQTADAESFLQVELKRIGYSMGIIYAIEELKLDKKAYQNILEEAWSSLVFLPVGQGKDILTNILVNLKKKWDVDYDSEFFDSQVNL